MSEKSEKIMSAIGVVIFIAIVAFIIYKRLNRKKYYLGGSWIGREIPVEKRVKSNGSTYYMAMDGVDLKIVNDKGEARYAKIQIKDFNPKNWENYSRAVSNGQEGYVLITK
jgi:hypothetical protein